MLHVSSVSKFTMDCPPLASSVLLGGRNRATTVQRILASLRENIDSYVAVPFMVLPAEALLHKIRSVNSSVESFWCTYAMFTILESKLEKLRRV